MINLLNEMSIKENYEGREEFYFCSNCPDKKLCYGDEETPSFLTPECMSNYKA